MQQAVDVLSGLSRSYLFEDLDRAGQPSSGRAAGCTRGTRRSARPGLHECRVRRDRILARELTGSRDDELAAAEALNGKADPSMRK